MRACPGHRPRAAPETTSMPTLPRASWRRQRRQRPRSSCFRPVCAEALTVLPFPYAALVSAVDGPARLSARPLRSRRDLPPSCCLRRPRLRRTLRRPPCYAAFSGGRRGQRVPPTVPARAQRRRAWRRATTLPRPAARASMHVVFGLGRARRTRRDSATQTNQDNLRTERPLHDHDGRRLVDESTASLLGPPLDPQPRPAQREGRAATKGS